MSLRDQLLKAGLVSSEQVKKAERDSRKQDHKVKKDKHEAAAEKARQAESARQRSEAERQKREMDRELNRQREAKKRRRATLGRVRQMLADQRQNDAKAEQLYNFQDGRKIRRVRVTSQQQKLLAMGKLGIARNPDDPFDFPLVSRATAEKLQAAGDEFMVLLYPETARLEEDDWPE